MTEMEVLKTMREKLSAELAAVDLLLSRFGVQSAVLETGSALEVLEKREPRGRSGMRVTNEDIKKVRAVRAARTPAAQADAEAGKARATGRPRKATGVVSALYEFVGSRKEWTSEEFKVWAAEADPNLTESQIVTISSRIADMRIKGLIERINPMKERPARYRTLVEPAAVQAAAKRWTGNPVGERYEEFRKTIPAGSPAEGAENPE